MQSIIFQPDVVLYDETSSQSIDVRPAQLAQAIADLQETLGAETALEVVELRVSDGTGAGSACRCYNCF